MTSEELQSLLHAVPFVPFVFCRDEGDVDVPDRDWVAHHPGTAGGGLDAVSTASSLPPRHESSSPRCRATSRSGSDRTGTCQ